MFRTLPINRRATVAVALVAAVAVAATAVQQSVAYFMDQTSTTVAVSTAEVDIAAGGTVAYQANQIVPGWSDTFTVNVTSGTEPDLDLRMFASDADTGLLAQKATLTVTQDGTQVYTGTVAGLPASYAGAAPRVVPTGVSTYVFDLSLPADVSDPNSLQGLAFGITLTFEGRTIGGA